MSPEGIQGKGIPEIQNSKFKESEAERVPGLVADVPRKEYIKGREETRTKA